MGFSLLKSTTLTHTYTHTQTAVVVLLRINVILSEVKRIEESKQENVKAKESNRLNRYNLILSLTLLAHID